MEMYKGQKFPMNKTESNMNISETNSQLREIFKSGISLSLVSLLVTI